MIAMDWGRILRRDQLAPLGEVFRKHGISCATTNGCFDLFGAHHLRFLQAIKSHGKNHCDVLIVGLNSDNSVMKLKGPDRPYISQADRAAILCGLEIVNHVYIFDEETPCDWLAMLKPTCHFKDESYEGGCPESAVVEAGGGRMVYLPTQRGESTTALIRRLRGCEPITDSSP